jgi:hypothetical protein
MTHVEVDLPPGPWIAVPVEGEVAAWADRTAEELCAGKEPPDVLAAELTVMAERVRPLEPLACAVLVPEQLPQAVVGVLVVHEVTDDLVAAELTAVELPVGPAARRRAVASAADGTIVETVEHVVPLGDGRGLRVDLSWSAIALGEELVELADGAAAGLALVED